MKSRRPIMIVEDDKIDVMTIKRALKEIKVSNKIIHRENGEDALAYLTDSNNEMPCIVLLDLNMPRMNGIEFLEKRKDIDSLKIIPVVVLTTSKEEKDRLSSFQYGIAGYMIKPVDYIQFIDVMRTIDLYWTLSELPGN
ncbi:MAG: response regulator [Chlorobi bacterium]|nr:response regulator [Chlorobiota bacterium]